MVLTDPIHWEVDIIDLSVGTEDLEQVGLCDILGEPVHEDLRTTIL